MMNMNLAVSDPLGLQEVIIRITLPPSQLPPEKRPVLLSLGVAEKLPVLRSGHFDELTTLIDAAWSAFAVRVQNAEGDEDKTVAVSQVVAITNIEEEDLPAVTPRQPTPPKPQAQNLSLF